MARVVKDRIKQTSTTTGTGTVALSASAAGYQNFSVLGDGNTTFYCIEDANGTAFEVGIGTYTSNTLARTTILDSTNSGNAISLTSGTHDVFVTYPAGRAGFNDEGLSPTLTASGTVTAGKPVIQNTNGTVTQVTGTSTTTDTGSLTQFESGSIEGVSSAYDSSNDRVVVAYRDISNSGYGTAVVGTVDNFAISFGTPVIFESASTNNTTTVFDSDSNKIVISYQDTGNSRKGTSIVGTVSGTSISFGSTVIFANADTRVINSCFDSSNNKVVIAYRDQDNSQYGTAIVGTVSGTSISFGSEAVFESGAAAYIEPVFDSNSNKVVIFYADVGDSFYPKAVVGTVSSTSISFGSIVTINSAQATSMAAVFDSSANKTVCAFGGGGGNKGAVGTVSGTSISFGTLATIAGAGNNSMRQQNASFDSANNKSVFVYYDGNNSNKATRIFATVSGTNVSFSSAVVVVDESSSFYIATTFDSTSNRFISSAALPTTGGGSAIVYSTVDVTTTTTNLTNDNFFGVASNSATTTNPVQINVPGSINNAQTGLTVDKDYYVTGAGLIKERTTTTVTPDTNPTASTITEQNGTAYSYWSNSIAYETTSGYYVRGRRVASSNYPCVESGTWGSLSTGITWNTPTVLSSNSLRNNEVRVATGGGYAHLAYCTRENSNENAKVTPVAISGSGSLSVGTTTTVSTTATSSSEARPYGIEYDTSQNTILAFFYLGWTSGYLNKVFPLQMSGANYSYSSSNAVTLTSGIDVYMKSLNTVFDPDTNRTIAFYHKNNSPLSIHGIVLSCSGASITKGATQSPSLTAPTSNSWSAVAYDTQNNKIIFMYYVSSPVNYAPKYSIVTVTGGATNTLSFTSDAYVFANTSQQAQACSLTWNGDANKLFMVYPEYIGSHIQCNTFTSNGSTLTTISQGEISTNAIPDSAGQEDDASVFVTGKGVSYSLGNADSSPGILNFTLSLGSTTSTVVNGSVFAGTALSATALELKTFPASTIVGKADGAVTKGKPLIVEADGDFAQAKTTTNNISFSKGSETSIQASVTSTYVFTSYNTAQNKFACFYEDTGASSYLYGNVITNDGTTLTAGSKSSAGNNFNTRILSVIYIGDSKHIIFMRNDSNNYFAAVVATVSGTSISYGTVNTFHSYSNHYKGSAYWDSDKNVAVFVGCYNSSSKNLAAYSFTVSGTTLTKTAGPVDNSQGVVDWVDNCYDSTNKIGVVAYTDGSDDGYVTTLSATSAGGLTWNTSGEAQISGSDNIELSSNAMTYDSANEKTILGYTLSSNGYLYTRPITLSGNPATTVAIGSASDVSGADVFAQEFSAIATDYGTIAYTYIQNSVYSYIKYKEGDASGSTISISGADNLVTGSDYYDAPPLAFNPTDNVIAGAYRNGADNDVDAVAFIASGSASSTNLTAENYIGIAQETVSTGNDVKVTTISGVDANQSSLTPAQLYYVQTDGTLSTTAGTPSVVAGTAIASTQLLVSRS